MIVISPTIGEITYMSRPREDLVGQRFGNLTVLEFVPKISNKGTKKSSYYICQCDCGNITNPISSNDLKRGHTKSCGCLRKNKINLPDNSNLDMVGKRFGRLVVTSIAPKIKGEPYSWYCTCDCGNTNIKYLGTELRAGRRISCGCQAKDSAHARYKNISGQKYGMLTVLEPADESYFGRKTGVKWLCRCDCGGIKIVSENLLERGEVISCGCLVSNSEYKIRQFLINHNIEHETQYKFKDCVNPKTQRKLKFDFAIFKNKELSFVVEYDGEQHFDIQRYSSDYDTNKKKYEELKYRDQIKDKYCKDNNIDLLRIPYTQKDDIEKILTNELREKGWDLDVPS